MLSENSNKRIEKILELENRKKIYELVKKYSGCHFREIGRKSGIPSGTLKYHLGFLVRKGLLIEKKQNNNLRYFVSDSRIENVKLLGFLRQSTIRKIILFILTNENCGHDDVVRFVQLSPSTVSWHLNKLIASGVIGRAKAGRNVRYKIAVDREEIMKLLITYKESFVDSLVNKVVEMWEIR